MRQELNRIVHLEDSANSAKYGNFGVYSLEAEKVLQSAVAQMEKERCEVGTEKRF